MSVTFTTGQIFEDEKLGEPVLVHGSRCDHGRTAECCEHAATYFGWCEHADADQAACGCKALDVNLSNPNAAGVLERLDFDPADPCGDATADDFLAHLLAGNPGQEESSYLVEVFARLTRLAVAAKERDLLVVWA